MPTPTRPIRVVLADDSALMRKMLREILERDPAIQVVACARDGAAAVEAVKEFLPDVVTLDINMPGMDGITALQTIMHESPRPVLMISSLTQEGALTTFECLELGAVDFVPKLSGTISKDLEQQERMIIDAVKSAAACKIGKPGRKGIEKRSISRTPAPSAPVYADRLVAIGVSTGGPKTLLEVLPLLPPDLAAAVVIVQHMPETFTESFARSLDKASKMPVKHAQAGDVLLNGHAYLAAGGKHLVFMKRAGGGYHVRYINEPADAPHIPSVDVMMCSAAATFGDRTIGVILTGMGADGAEGMVQIRKAGGYGIAEAESTCVIFGMPAVAIARGGANCVLPCDAIANRVVKLLRKGL